MARIPSSASAFAPPSGARLRFIASRLSTESGLEIRYSEVWSQEISASLGSIIGLYLVEQSRPTTRAVIAKLKAVERAISLLTETLALERGGFVRMDPVAQETWWQIVDALTRAPTVGIREAASKFILDELDRMQLLGHASLIAQVELKKIRGEKGRDQLIWYDRLTALLVEVAEHLGLSTALSQDRVTKRPVGVFYRMAELFELALPKGMRSPSAIARLRRLERGLARLK